MIERKQAVGNCPDFSQSVPPEAQKGPVWGAEGVDSKPVLSGAVVHAAGNID